MSSSLHDSHRATMTQRGPPCEKTGAKPFIGGGMPGKSPDSTLRYAARILRVIGRSPEFL